MTTKQDYKNKVLQQFNEKFSPIPAKYRVFIEPFLSKSIDEIVELAFKECGVGKWDVGLKESYTQGFNSCISERSKLENKFLGK